MAARKIADEPLPDDVNSQAQSAHRHTPAGLPLRATTRATSAAVRPGFRAASACVIFQTIHVRNGASICFVGRIGQSSLACGRFHRRPLSGLGPVRKRFFDDPRLERRMILANELFCYMKSAFPI